MIKIFFTINKRFVKFTCLLELNKFASVGP